MGMLSYFGYRCPKCGSTVDIGVTTGRPSCPTCGTTMAPNEGAKSSAGNVYCPRCKASYGLVNSDKCPQCGGPFSPLL
jgi:DNA-directed RNA polymerase subunit RPC12/RpoP